MKTIFILFLLILIALAVSAQKPVPFKTTFSRKPGVATIIQCKIDTGTGKKINAYALVKKVYRDAPYKETVVTNNFLRGFQYDVIKVLHNDKKTPYKHVVSIYHY